MYSNMSRLVKAIFRLNIQECIQYSTVYGIVLYVLYLKNKIFRTIILPVCLYVCEMLSHTLREERRLRVFENRMLRIIFGSKRDEVTGELRKLHNECLMICTVHQKNEIGGACSMHGERRGVYRVLEGKPDGKRRLGRPRHR
jgi:hypothetical protein